ncbi:hypothetical protein C8A05DRAFT_47447 [Staphylotrichum tortipilum]|uniref:LPXTG-domain-containing protein n=1 Tax=Staphylotrichum tortipilum TaxID=2831512 RepID=A0AAN6MDQ4_9PEZI|nr:hypothetical protein C8A05DRAFT_47447 [Staphylotrichum longicolle]
MARSSTRALLTLVTLFSATPLSSALQVTANSPCSAVCRDSLDLDASDPNSSNTRNSDITCLDAAYSSAAGNKFKNCMTCLQTSTFSQGSESDTMWFLYNMRYAVSYCIFGFPNATDIASTPCSTIKACGHLDVSMEHGIKDPSSTTAYSYCKAGTGAAMDSANFESCIPCIAAEGKTNYLVNYLVGLEAGCRQQPAPGVLLGLNDTVFANAQITIVDPTTLKQNNTPKSEGLGIPVIVGIVAAAVAAILIAGATTFICLRKRNNRRARANAEADYYGDHRHRSSMSFQCQTHMVSPRFWPAAGPEEGLSTPATDSPDGTNQPGQRSSIWKPHTDLPEYPYHEDAATTVVGDDDSTTTKPTTATHHISKKAAMAAVPLHHITTAVPAPTRPAQAYTSPSSLDRTYHSPSDFRSPLSADSARSSSALLPAIKPYVPAEHGVHIPGSSPTTTPAPFPSVAAAAASPVISSPGRAGAGTGMTPLLKSSAWPLPEPSRRQSGNGSGTAGQQRNVIKLGNTFTPPPPPPIKTTRGSALFLGSGIGGGRNSPRVAGSPVESWEIQTAFAAPPRR